LHSWPAAVGAVAEVADQLEHPAPCPLGQVRHLEQVIGLALPLGQVRRPPARLAAAQLLVAADLDPAVDPQLLDGAAEIVVAHVQASPQRVPRDRVAGGVAGQPVVHALEPGRVGVVALVEELVSSPVGERVH